MQDEELPAKISIVISIGKEQGERFKLMADDMRCYYHELLIILMDWFEEISGDVKSPKPAPASTYIQLTIHIDKGQGERFKRMAKDHRSQSRFITALMDAYKGK
ncbi:MAG: hypothetical protein ACNYPF_03725 [Candidatus Puniceispirillales bacterium WSBS_2018_MAG_OTU23]